MPCGAKERPENGPVSRQGDNFKFALREGKAYALRSMIVAMSQILSASPRAATRQLPVARGREAGAAVATVPPAPASDSRLQAAVVRKDASVDPYADVPCTD